MQELTTERQHTETEIKIWHEDRGCRYCYICNKHFVAGDEVYLLQKNLSKGRHASCLRKPAKVKEDFSGRPSASFTGRRRRNGGHGYSGGDGFQNI